jgi:hypothetical protein
LIVQDKLASQSKAIYGEDIGAVKIVIKPWETITGHEPCFLDEPDFITKGDKVHLTRDYDLGLGTSGDGCGC